MANPNVSKRDQKGARVKSGARETIDMLTRSMDELGERGLRSCQPVLGRTHLWAQQITREMASLNEELLNRSLNGQLLSMQAFGVKVSEAWRGGRFPSVREGKASQQSPLHPYSTGPLRLEIQAEGAGSKPGGRDLRGADRIARSFSKIAPEIQPVEPDGLRLAGWGCVE